MPREWAHYEGLFRHGSNVVFRYTVGGCEVLDMPGLIDSGGHPFFTRTLRVGASAQPFTLRLRERLCADVLPPGEACPSVIVIEGQGIEVRLAGQHIEATFPPRAQAVTAKFLFVDSRNGHSIPFDNLDRVHVPDLPDVARGGPALWPEVLNTVGKRAADEGPFAVDTVAQPDHASARLERRRRGGRLRQLQQRCRCQPQLPRFRDGFADGQCGEFLLRPRRTTR